MRISLLFCMLIFICSCGSEAPASKQAQADLISGTKWVFDWGDMQDSLMARPVSQRDINFFNNFKTRAENAIFHFKEDGIFEVQTSPTEYQAGKWYLDSRNSTLKMEIYKTPINNPLPILKLTKDRFELGPDLSPDVPHSMHRIFIPYNEGSTEAATEE